MEVLHPGRLAGPQLGVDLHVSQLAHDRDPEHHERDHRHRPRQDRDLQQPPAEEKGKPRHARYHLVSVTGRQRPTRRRPPSRKLGQPREHGRRAGRGSVADDGLGLHHQKLIKYKNQKQGSA
jgi:hypothetical protein